MLAFDNVFEKICCFTYGYFCHFLYWCSSCFTKTEIQLLLVLIDVVVGGKEIKLAKAKLFIFILAFLQSLLQCAQINVEIRRRKKTSSSSHKVTKTLSDF